MVTKREQLKMLLTIVNEDVLFENEVVNEYANYQVGKLIKLKGGKSSCTNYVYILHDT